MLPRVIWLSQFSRTREIRADSQLCSKMQNLIFERTIVHFVKIFQFSFIVKELLLFIFSSICLFINTFNPFVIKSSEFCIISNENTTDKSILFYNTD